MRIGELADAVGVNPKTVRFYEDIGLLPEPERTPSGYRDYSEADRDRLVFVRTAQRLGLPLADIAEILAFKERGEAPCGYVRTVLARQVAELDDRIDELIALREQLRALQAIADDLPPRDDCYCRVIEHAAALTDTSPLPEGATIVPVPIDRDHLQQLITEDDAQVIEVLPRAEYNWAHLTGAVHLWLRDTGTGKRDQRTRQIRRRTHPPGAHLE